MPRPKTLVYQNTGTGTRFDQRESGRKLSCQACSSLKWELYEVDGRVVRACKMCIREVPEAERRSVHERELKAERLSVLRCFQDGNWHMARSFYLRGLKKQQASGHCRALRHDGLIEARPSSTHTYKNGTAYILEYRITPKGLATLERHR